jgi:hypothetical protein
MTTKAFELAQLGDTVTVSSDNVGIGTSSPVAKLQIKTQTNGNAAFQNSTSVSGGVKINAFNDAANVSVPFEIDGSSLQFNIASTERMRIDTNGNVGIACAPNSSSSGVAGLSIGDGAGPLGSLVSDGASNTETRLGHGYYFDGSNYKHETANVGVAIYQQLGNNAGAQHIWFSNAGGSEDATFTPTERMRIDSSGNVGIGTGSPSSLFEVNKGSAGTLATFTDGVNSNFVVETASLITTVGNTGGSTALAFKSSNTERMRIDASGNVGIGTSSPSERLHVAGLAKADSGFLIGNAYLYEGAIDQVNMRIGTDGPYLEFLDAGSNVAEVGNASGPLALTSAGTERMRINSSGNVGIGTSSPSSRMQVSTAGTSTTTNTNVVARFVTNGSNADSHIQISNGVDHSANIGIAGGANLYFANDGTERMRIDSSGNVGIGTSSPQATAEISGGLDNRLRINSTDGTTSNNYGIDFSTAGTVRGGIRYNAGNNYLAFYGYDNTERMRLTSDGSLRLGTTSNEGITNQFTVKYGGGGAEYGMVMRPAADTTVPIYFQNASGGNVGSISITASSTSYNTSSDYRLKENVTDVTDGITRVKQLAPKRFNFIADPDTTVDGFLAHEAQAVVPEAVTGTHNEVDDDGNAKMQGIDQAKLVPLLTAALQEAIAKIETLETKVAALEGA